MELPNYSRQLMQQLHALRREGQFCDCTILVGESPHRAHKLVLAASSLLFRSLLEGSDSISIDPALVTSQEFSSLLEMAYTGRLPPGKHNFTRIIAAADSLQMFDLAVSCKNILTNLMKQPPDTPGLSPVTTPQCLPAAVAPDVEKDPLKGLREAIGQTNAEAEGCRGEDARNVIQQVEQTATEDGKGSPCENHHQESPGGTGSRAGAEYLEFLFHSRDKIAEAIGDLQLWVKAMEMWERISSVERQVILDCGKKDPETPSVFYKLLNCATEGGSLSPHTLLTLLELLKEYHPKLAPLLQEPAEQEDSTNRGPAAGMSVEERSESDVPLLTHSVELIDLLSDISFLTDSLIIAANSCLEEREREVVYEVCRDRTPREAAEQLLKQVWEEGTVSEGSLHKLLRTLHKSSPGLQLLLEGTQTSTDTAADKPDEARLLRKYRSRLLEWVYDPQNLLLTLEAITGFPAEERECIQGFLKQSSGAQCLDRIVSLALEGSSLSALSVWRLLFRAAAQNSWLEMLTGEVREEPGAEKLIQSVMDSESLHLDILLKHKSLILENVRDLGALESVKDPGSMAEELTEFVQTCREGILCLSMKDILGQILEEKSLSAQPFCMMLSMNRQSFPQLLPLFSDLEQAGKEAELKGVQMSGALEGTDVGKERGGASKQCFCQWCGKAFAFRCRMEVHRRRCPLSRETSHRCPRCPQELATPRALQQHLAQAHEGPARKKRKRQELVACDLCEKTFAHPSGMLYHKRTDHFDEKPYACEECGAKFAANSSLKNHVRLHTGERPFHCKHCDMSFSQAAALSYHTKKKHSEGKMYACQYCEALFAQSIELTRHVRTHTGDKPYVCRECGKGFSQANGLSVHLHTFHNIADPHDCQKCRMSFASLEEHRKHIQECHPKEYHQCDKCKKIFNSDALLEKHAVIHVGGKPHSCKICHKAYQQLSGLWYHNRTTHPEVFAGQSHRLLKSLFQCMACDKAFSSSTSLAKHEKSEHPEKVFKCDDCEQHFTESDLLVAHKKENHSESQIFKCLYCPGSFHTAAEVQLHLCNQHFSQEGEVSGCAHCDLLFPSQLELQEHFLSKHHDVLSENSQVSTSQMVIQTEEPSGGTEEVITLDQSQLGCSQVYVALGDSESSTSGAEIVAVNMEDLLDGTVTFICGESQ